MKINFCQYATAQLRGYLTYWENRERRDAVFWH